MENHDPQAFLLFALKHFDIELICQEGKKLFLDMDYIIEVESENLYKLMQGGQVVAPFSDVEELCHFIKMDMQLNEKN